MADADVDADAVISVMCYAVRGGESQWEEECMWKSRVISPHYSHEGQICIHTHTHNRVFPRERQNKRKPCKGDLQRGMSTCAYSHTHTSPSLSPCIPINLLSSFYTLSGPQRNQACTCMKMTSHLGYNNQYSSSSSSNRVVAK